MCVHQNRASLESNQFKARKTGTLGRMEHSQLLLLLHVMGQAHPYLHLFLSWWGPEVAITMLIPSHLASKYQLWSKCSSEESQDRVPLYFFAQIILLTVKTSESRNLTFRFMFVFIFWFPLFRLAEFLVLSRGSVRKSSLNCLMLQMSLLTVYKYLLCSSQALSCPKHRLNSTAVQVTMESCIGQTLTALWLDLVLLENAKLSLERPPDTAYFRVLRK